MVCATGKCESRVCYISCLGQQTFQMVTRDGPAWLECRALARLPWVLHAFSTRRGGASRQRVDLPSPGLNLGFTEWDRRRRVERNRRQFFSQLGGRDFALASLRQIHSSLVYQVARGAGETLEYRPCGISPPKISAETLPAGDALLTDQAGILLSVRGADCLLVVLADSGHRAVAAVHAGWRGALDRVVEKAVGEMRRVFGSRPELLQAALGPSIRVCCYEVGDEVVEAFHGCFQRPERFFQRVPQAPGTSPKDRAPAFLEARPPGQALQSGTATHLDLVAVARAQLVEAGLSPRHISVAEFCTACRTDLFYSHRREGSRTGRIMAVIGIRPTQESRL